MSRKKEHHQEESQALCSGGRKENFSFLIFVHCVEVGSGLEELLQKKSEIFIFKQVECKCTHVPKLWTFQHSISYFLPWKSLSTGYFSSDGSNYAAIRQQTCRTYYKDGAAAGKRQPNSLFQYTCQLQLRGTFVSFKKGKTKVPNDVHVHCFWQKKKKNRAPTWCPKVSHSSAPPHPGRHHHLIYSTGNTVAPTLSFKATWNKSKAKSHNVRKNLAIISKFWIFSLLEWRTFGLSAHLLLAAGDIALRGHVGNMMIKQTCCVSLSDATCQHNTSKLI